LALNSGRCVLRFFVSLMVYPFLWTVSHLNTCLKFGVHFRATEKSIYDALGLSFIAL
jgi:hypothetical protein